MFSASQVSTFELCERQWGWKYLEKIRLPPGVAAQFGLDGHVYIEESLGNRYWDTSSPFWARVEPSRKFLERIPDDAEIEVYFEVELASPSGAVHKFRGYKDVQGIGNGVPYVIDHKFTGNLNYAKEPEDLVKDVQATLYAHEAMVRYYSGEPGPVNLVWSYYRRTDAPATKLVKMRVYPNDIQPRISKTIATADKMQAAIDAGKRAGDMPPNWDACHSFGGCPFRDHCEQEETAKGTGIHVDEKRKALMNMLNGMANNTPALSAPATPADDMSSQKDHEPPFNCPEPPAFNAPADTAAKDAPIPYAMTALAIDATETEPSPKSPAKGQVKRKKTTLFVNCMPLGGKVPASASTLFAKATAKLGIAHYKLAEYGKGPGLFAAALREVIDQEGGLPSELYLWTGTSEGRDAYEVLVGYADSVILGVPG